MNPGTQLTQTPRHKPHTNPRHPKHPGPVQRPKYLGVLYTAQTAVSELRCPKYLARSAPAAQGRAQLAQLTV